jgi:MoxR-like ATPase
VPRFQWLLTKFSTPEEVFGPVSLKGLENDKYLRVTSGKLPECHIAFLDEIFKANSSILNSMLTIINERVYHNGVPVKVPLLSLFGASNEMPEAESLEALFDRFLIRFWVDYISDQDALKDMLFADEPSSNGVTLTLADIEEARADVALVKFDEDAIQLLLTIKNVMEEKGFKVSDRRWKKMIRAVRAFAYLNGCDSVGQDHFELLIDMLWREPKDVQIISSEIRQIINPFLAKVTALLDAAKELVSNLPKTGTDRIAMVSACANATAELEKMIEEAEKLTGSSKNVKATTAIEEIKVMHKSIQKKAMCAFGLK